MPVKSKKETKKKNALTVDFSDTEVKVLLPEGEYHVKVKSVEVETSENSGNDYLKWTFQVMDDDSKLNGHTLYYNTSLQPQALWNLRNLLETMGVETEQGEMRLELEDYVDKEFMVTVEHEAYEGKKKAKVTDYSPLEGGTANVEDDESEAEESDESDESEESDETDDADEVDESEEEETDEDTEEESEEEEKISADEIKTMKVDELQDLVKRLKLDIKKPNPLPKKFRAQVLDALEKAELLAE